MQTICGFPVLVPNTTIEAPGFYISYNNYDVELYGGVTTALVKGQGEHFYILYGDHRSQYALLLTEGFEACLNYFKANIHLISKFSEKGV